MLRFAVRSVRRAPIFALTAASVLALGIGANATVFTIVNTLILRPLPFEPGRYTLATVDAAEPITACRVSSQFFDVLGVSPVRGRLFTQGDTRTGVRSDDAAGAPAKRRARRKTAS